MAVCDACGKEIPLPFRCSYCGGTFCSDHRLPENHACRKSAEEAEGEPSRAQPAPDAGREPQKPIRVRYEFEIPGPLGRPRRRRIFPVPSASMMILMLISLTFVVQLIAQEVLGVSYFLPGRHDTFLYYLAPSPATVVERPWTIITSIFAHGGFLHLFFNGVVLLSFGPVLEARIGGRKFIHLFFVIGIMAGVAQLFFIPSEAVLLGASGSLLGVLGTLTVLSPRMPVLVFFFVPLKLWIATLGFGVISAFLAFTQLGGSIGHMAHFVGLIGGLVYGYKLRRDERRRQENVFRQLLGPFSELWP
jgi:membrane associated rhomboid family serine protease